MNHVSENIYNAPLPFILDPGQAVAVAWAIYGHLRLSVPPGGPTFKELQPSDLDTRDGLLLGILREMTHANVWKETPEAAKSWAEWTGPDGEIGPN